MTIKYWAIATWNGKQWDVRIEDYDQRHRGDTVADNLELDAVLGPDLRPCFPAGL